MSIGIGSKVWLSRQWSRGVVELTVTGETRVSWLVGEGWQQFKIPKRHAGDTFRVPSHNGYGSSTAYLSREAVDDAEWRADNEHRLRRHIEDRLRIMTVPELRRLAEFIGYAPEPQP